MAKHMPQSGGEGKGAYKGKKGTSPAKQHGGEGKGMGMMTGSMNKGMEGEEYCGPGRNLGSEK